MSEGNAALQRLWLEVRCSAIGSAIHEEKLKRFLSTFLSCCSSKNEVNFKSVFGGTTDLVIQVCKDFVSHAKKVLSVGEEEIVNVTSEGVQELLVLVLLFLANSDDTTASLSKIFETFADYNICALTVMLHSQIITVLEGHSSDETEVLVRVDNLYLKLLGEILNTPLRDSIRRCITECAHESAMCSAVSAIVFCYKSRVPVSVDVSETALFLFKRQVACNPARGALERVSRMLEEAVENSSCSGNARLGVLSALKSILEGLIVVREKVGYNEPETLNFNALGSALISLESVISENLSHGSQIVQIIGKLATHPRVSANEKKVEENRRKSSLLKLIPGTLGKLHSSISGVSPEDGAPARPTVQCPEAVECLTTVFICSSRAGTSHLYGTELFKVAFTDCEDTKLTDYVLETFKESLSSFSGAQMSFVCGILVNIQKEYDITDFVGFIVDCLLKCSIKDGDSKLVLVDFFVSYVSNNPEVGASVIRRGLLQAVLRNVDKESFQAEPTRRYVERLSVLLKILIREDTDTKPLEEVEFPNALLDLLLFFFEKGEKRTAVVLRDMYSFLLIKTMSFFNNIVIRLSNATETKPWGEDTTVLLATLIGALRKRIHAERAIASNALELCFTLVRDIENSLYPAVDLELLGCILNFILPSVAHSDVWVLFESSIGTMRRTTESTQFVIDLCCGDFQTLKRMRMAALVFEEQHPEIDRRGPGYHVYGEYFLPKTPFCEFEYLLNVLFNWSSQAFEKSEADSDSLVKVVESLLVLSGTKISNTYAVKHIMTHGRLGLLPCVMNITDPTLRPLFFSDDHSLQSILHKQDAWLAALQHSPVEENEYKYNVRFAGPSGASGLVKCTEMWPSLDGYSVSIWVSWNLLASTEADQRMQLWQMSWVSSGKRFAVSLSVNATKECCCYTISEDQASQTVELPYIPPYSWTHVVTSHRRTKLFSSDISVYFNGCNVLSKEFSYPFGVQTAMNSVAAFPSFFTNLHCTVGSSPDYSGQAAMSLISFSVFNCELSSEDVFSLYSYGPNPKGGAKWDKGGTDTVSIESNYLHDEVLRGLEVCNSTDQLDSVCEQRFLTFSLPFRKPLIHLHVRSMNLVDSELTYMNNKNWAYLNGTNYQASDFVLYGNHTIPPKGLSNEIDALLSHGAMREWLQWIRAIDEASMGEVELVKTVARRFLFILSTAHTQAELHSSMWRRFTSHFISILIKNPKKFLVDNETIRCVLSLSIRLIKSGDEYAKVIYYNAYLEHIFFNWEILSSLSIEGVTYLLDILNELVSQSNGFHAFNTMRFLASDFVNGFVCGLMREWTPVYIVEKAGDVIGSVLSGTSNLSEVLGGLLTTCAVSVPSGSDFPPCANLISKLSSVAMEHIANIRNVILKTICTFWDNSKPGKKRQIAYKLNRILTSGWFSVMLSAQSHPVTVVLSLRLFVICFTFCESWRTNDAIEQNLFLVGGLVHHAHQTDVTELLMSAFRGTVWSPFYPETNKQKSEISEDSSHNLFLLVYLHLVKRLSQILLNGEKVNFKPINCYEYFETILIPARENVVQRKWKRILNGIRFAFRLQRKKYTPKLTEAPYRNQVTLTEANIKRLQGSVAATIDWMSTHYGRNKRLRHALYRSDNTTNLLDMLSWPLIASLGSTGVQGEVTLGPVSPVPTDPSLAIEENTLDEETGEDEDEDDDSEWETIQPVVVAHSQSFGLDEVTFRPGFERLYNSCQNFFMTFASERINSTDLFAQTRGRAGVSAYVQALHRTLVAEAKGVGSQTENWRSAFLCFAWMKSAELCVDQESKVSASTLKNVVALAKYMLDRLVAGLAVPPKGLVQFFISLSLKLNQNRETVSSCLTGVFEWTLYVMNPDYYYGSAERAASVVNMLSECQGVLFSKPLPTVETLNVIVKRLLELTFALTSTPSACGASCKQMLYSFWEAVIVSNRNNTHLLALLQCQDCDVWELFDPNRAGADRDAWWRRICEKRSLVYRCADHIACNVVFVLAEGGKYLKTAKKAEYAFFKQQGQDYKKLNDSKAVAAASWQRHLSTSTFVDPSLFYAEETSFNDRCLTIPDPTDPEGGKYFLHNGKLVGIRTKEDSAYTDGLSGEPLNHYIRYTPPLCIPFYAAPDNTGVQLKPNAAAVLSKITGPAPSGRVHYATNVYLLTGVDTHICTLVITESEIVIISCSQVTNTGDFFITKIISHEASQQSSQKSSFRQEAQRLFTWGPATSTKAAFRISQYYRQLRSEAMEGSSSLVWRFFLGNIQVVHQRSFQHLPCALEVVMETGERVFMVALNEEFSFSKSVRDKVVNTVAHLSPRVRVETAAAKKSHLVEATNLWVESALSTRVYLDILNDSASRTAADIGQYPVYPWVLKDYTSSSVNLGDPTLYRDLSRPIGALNENKATQLDRRYRQWTVDDGDTPYHYGTHYSSAAIVLYYLVRVEPFTSLSIHFQGGRLDLPDRLFHSVSESWDSCSGPGSGDVKELIPEFYTISGFLQNKNNTKLGVRRDGVSLGHVEIPPWAHNCDHFRHVHLMALESDRVGERIHEWFNLVFGYKQQGEDAVEAINVFNPLSYHDGVQHAINKAATEEEKRSIVASADNFGQTPPQLFKTPHPVRSRKSEFYPIQNYWIRHVTRVYKLSFPLTATNIPPGLPADQLYNIDGFFYNGSPQHVLSTSSPIQTFHYNRTTDAITCTLAKSQSIVAIVPFILSLGCGAFTCMTVSATGNILAVGTDRGSIVVFTRGGLAGRFSVWDVLHLNRTDNPVISLNLLDQGELIATYEKEAKVTGWHVSLVHSMFLFDTNMEHPSDPSPVMSVCKDKQKRILYGAKSQTVCVFTFDGVVLSRLFVPQCAPDYGLTDITCLCFCNCPSFSTDNILIMGHKGQILSIWDVRSEVTATAEGPVYYSFEVLHTLSVDGEVCSLLDDVPRYCVGVGMENGSITVMGFPPPDNDEK